MRPFSKENIEFTKDSAFKPYAKDPLVVSNSTCSSYNSATNHVSSENFSKLVNMYNSETRSNTVSPSKTILSNSNSIVPKKRTLNSTNTDLDKDIQTKHNITSGNNIVETTTEPQQRQLSPSPSGDSKNNISNNINNSLLSYSKSSLISRQIKTPQIQSHSQSQLRISSISSRAHLRHTQHARQTQAYAEAYERERERERDRDKEKDREKEREREAAAEEELRAWQRQWRKILTTSRFYFDGIDDSRIEEVKKKLQYCGSMIEPFFNNLISHVISNRTITPSTPSSAVILKAKQYKIKVWTFEKLLRFLNNLFNCPSCFVSTYPEGYAHHYHIYHANTHHNHNHGHNYSQYSRLMQGSASCISVPGSGTASLPYLAASGTTSALASSAAIAAAAASTQATPIKAPNSTSASHGVSTNNVGADLSHLLREEQIYGPTDRDPRARRDDYHYFKGPYIMVWDLSNYYRPTLLREYPKVPSNMPYSGEWPQIYWNSSGKCPFLPINTYLSKRREKHKQQVSTIRQLEQKQENDSKQNYAVDEVAAEHMENEIDENKTDIFNEKSNKDVNDTIDVDVIMTNEQKSNLEHSLNTKNSNVMSDSKNKNDGINELEGSRTSVLNLSTTEIELDDYKLSDKNKAIGPPPFKKGKIEASYQNESKSVFNNSYDTKLIHDNISEQNAKFKSDSKSKTQSRECEIDTSIDKRESVNNNAAITSSLHSTQLNDSVDNEARDNINNDNDNENKEAQTSVEIRANDNDYKCTNDKKDSIQDEKSSYITGEDMQVYNEVAPIKSTQPETKPETGMTTFTKKKNNEKENEGIAIIRKVIVNDKEIDKENEIEQNKEKEKEKERVYNMRRHRPLVLLAESKLNSRRHPSTFNYRGTQKSSIDGAMNLRTMDGGISGEMHEIIATGLNMSNITSATKSMAKSGGSATALGHSAAGVSKEVANLSMKLFERTTKPAATPVPARMVSREAVESKEMRPGYCENCRDKFDDFDTHMESKKHKKWALDNDNFTELDDFLVKVQRPLKSKKSTVQQ